MRDRELSNLPWEAWKVAGLGFGLPFSEFGVCSLAAVNTVLENRPWFSLVWLVSPVNRSFLRLAILRQSFP